ncbi:MAG: Uncharacterized protein FD161_330 [Limisphaerales bacterium]|nr:MAG: Uncharacterized protein FD161_330 [Limisphaerales bacterium]KAG0510776.1 MAG: hypothetical protein E1N63_330 [Limisphaerales bacterium]TXT52672.1 MAG: Uncharacterized protein FD140_592 [Limisphaerales bacterium]
MKHLALPRRTFLRGLGTLMALPALDAMTPALKAAAAKTAPRRTAFVYVPNGMNMAHWWPETVGKGYDLPAILKPLVAHRDDFSVLSGLAQVSGRAGADGAGDHARANATWLTGQRARKTAGADIQVGVSIDQVLAEQVGKQTRFDSLELGCDKARTAGACDSGYSCAYQFNLAWKGPATPMPPEANPKQVFERLFGNGSNAEEAAARQKREQYNQSILDFVLEDANSLKRQLGATDRRKLDEYMTAVREMEERIQQAEKFKLANVAPIARKDFLPQDYSYEQHIRMMYDLMVLAFQTDSTRIATFLVAHDGSNRSYPFIGVPDGHHDLSHHGGDEAKLAKIAKINTFHTTQFAYFLEKLKSVKEGNGTLLDNCAIMFGSGLADGNRHAHHDLPILLAGRGGGTIKSGQSLEFKQETPLCNLFVSLADRMNAKVDKFGDSTGRLEAIAQTTERGPRQFPPDQNLIWKKKA